MSLAELLVGSAAALVVGFAALGLYQVAARGQESTGGRSVAVQDAITGVERMTREIRDAREVAQAAGVATVNFVTQANDVAGKPWRHVRWTCTTAGATAGTYECQRFLGVDANVAGSVSATSSARVVEVLNQDVFTTTPATGSATFVAIKLRLRVTQRRTDGGSGTYTLEDGVRLRNA